jgi:hypothetical protein
MKKMLLTVFVSLCLLNQHAYAWSQKDQVVEVVVIHGNITLIKFKGLTWQGCNGGTPTNPNPYFVLSEGDNVSDQRKQMLSIALTALTSGKDVYVVTGVSAGDAPQCDANGYEWVYQLSILQ